ncbi:hypothetical protein [Pseudoruegeria sp. SK021]|uniref:hypothetical protein n=1 Tax=Pseudoruegeria sp. SK021 TaxID=1933035 RepID=UPI000A253B62|nr:hypothetical protein [Pseudoruegeria sp. SK021]OSP56495.1 hypothetical protein BV911_00590 [Pseudoruegeria sp. SK021]
MAVHAYTSFSLSYYNRARVWAESTRRAHPEWVLWAVLTDRAPEGFDPAALTDVFDRVLMSDDLLGDTAEAWLFCHDVIEACTAVKGAALEHILDQPEVEKVFYFDPDTAIFNRHDPMVDALDHASILLTPHQVTPDTNRIAIIDNEITSLHYGTFNLGFLAVRNDAETRRFARWWTERLTDWCHDRLDIGVFVDQKWCNLVPCFFDDVKIWRDPGYNVASWNLSQRTLAFDDTGELTVNGQPLRFFHFTKLGPIGDVMTQRYAAGNTEVYEIWSWYRMQVEAATRTDIPPGWWYYGVFENGTRIPKAARELYRNRADLRTAFPNPRNCDGKNYCAWLLENTELLA